MTTQLGILTVLEMCGEHLLPEMVLVADTERLLGRKIGSTEILREAEKLEGRRQIITVNSEDKGRQYRITDLGRARLLE
jgi:hypothetical protein